MVNSYVKLPEGNQTCWKTLNLFWRNPVRHWRISQCCWQICDVWSKNLYSSCMFLQMTPQKLCSTSKQTYILQRCVCVCLRLNISGYKRYAFRTFRFSRHGSKRFFFAEFIGSQGTHFPSWRMNIKSSSNSIPQIKAHLQTSRMVLLQHFWISKNIPPEDSLTKQVGDLNPSRLSTGFFSHTRLDPGENSMPRSRGLARSAPTTQKYPASKVAKAFGKGQVSCS